MSFFDDKDMEFQNVPEKKRNTFTPFFEKLKLKAPLFPAKKSKLGESWELSSELFRFTKNNADAFTFAEAFRGTQILGSPGSGKTSGSGQVIGLSFLERGLGGIVLCVKDDEAENWEKLCLKAGREKDVRRITLGGNLTYNFLEAEAKSSPFTLVTNIADLFCEISAVINRTENAVESDSFWKTTLNRMLCHAIVLEIAAHGTVTILGLANIINGAVEASLSGSMKARRESDQLSLGMAETFFLKSCALARKTKGDDYELGQALQYFQGEFSALSEKTRSIVVAQFMGMADPLLRSPLKEMLCEKTTCRPEETFDGKIIIVDVPVHTHQKMGRVINLIWKESFKRACKRRKEKERPLFLWADENQYLLTSTDGVFQTTARSLRCCVVYLTQNLQNYYAELKNRDAVKALLGSLNNKIYHQNNEDETNAFATEAIGKISVSVQSENKSKAEGFWDNSNERKSISTTQQWEYDVPKRLFTNLKSGGGPHKFVVEGIVHIPGRKFSSGKTWLKAAFLQKK